MMINTNQLYVHKDKGYHTLIIKPFYSIFAGDAWIVETNWDEAPKGPLVLDTRSIQKSFTLVANNYQPK